MCMCEVHLPHLRARIHTYTRTHVHARVAAAWLGNHVLVGVQVISHRTIMTMVAINGIHVCAACAGMATV
jgi:hypothetical protein